MFYPCCLCVLPLLCVFYPLLSMFYPCCLCVLRLLSVCFTQLSMFYPCCLCFTPCCLCFTPAVCVLPLLSMFYPTMFYTCCLCFTPAVYVLPRYVLPLLSVFYPCCLCFTPAVCVLQLLSPVYYPWCLSVFTRSGLHIWPDGWDPGTAGRAGQTALWNGQQAGNTGVSNKHLS